MTYIIGLHFSFCDVCTLMFVSKIITYLTMSLITGTIAALVSILNCIGAADEATNSYIDDYSVSKHSRFVFLNKSYR